MKCAWCDREADYTPEQDPFVQEGIHAEGVALCDWCYDIRRDDV